MKQLHWAPVRHFLCFVLEKASHGYPTHFTKASRMDSRKVFTRRNSKCHLKLVLKLLYTIHCWLVLSSTATKPSSCSDYLAGFGDTPSLSLENCCIDECCTRKLWLTLHVKFLLEKICTKVCIAWSCSFIINLSVFDLPVSVVSTGVEVQQIKGDHLHRLPKHWPQLPTLNSCAVLTACCNHLRMCILCCQGDWGCWETRMWFSSKCVWSLTVVWVHGIFVALLAVRLRNHKYIP